MKNNYRLILCVLLSTVILLAGETAVTIWSKGNYALLGTIDSEHNGDIIYYNIHLTIDGKTVYEDSLDIIIWNGAAAQVRKFDKGNKSVLLYVADDRPLKDKLRLIFLTHDKVTKAVLAPNFYDQISNLTNKDQKVSGVLDFTEAYCLDCDSSFYNPKLVYQISIDEFRLDSTETKTINESEIGVFLGFTITDDIVPKKDAR